VLLLLLLRLAKNNQIASQFVWQNLFLPANIFAGKNYFCHPSFSMKKRFFSTNRQKPANPGYRLQHS